MVEKKLYKNYMKYLVKVADVGHVKFVKDGIPLPKAHKYLCSLVFFL
jgi:hypothetical protein